MDVDGSESQRSTVHSRPIAVSGDTLSRTNRMCLLCMVKRIRAMILTLVALAQAPSTTANAQRNSSKALENPAGCPFPSDPPREGHTKVADPIPLAFDHRQ